MAVLPTVVGTVADGLTEMAALRTSMAGIWPQGSNVATAGPIHTGEYMLAAAAALLASSVRALYYMNTMGLLDHLGAIRRSRRTCTVKKEPMKFVMPLLLNEAERVKTSCNPRMKIASRQSVSRTNGAVFRAYSCIRP